MKITYEFDTTSENYDKFEMLRIQKSLDMALALWDLDGKIRNWRKWDERDAIPVEEITDAFVEILEKHMINLDDIVE